MAEATLTAKGQATIPKAIRDHLKVKPGDKITFRIEQHGQVSLSARTLSVRDVAGMLRRYARGKPPTIREMSEAAELEAARGVMRGLKKRR